MINSLPHIKTSRLYQWDASIGGSLQASLARPFKSSANCFNSSPPMVSLSSRIRASFSTIREFIPCHEIAVLDEKLPGVAQHSNAPGADRDYAHRIGPRQKHRHKRKIRFAVGHDLFFFPPPMIRSAACRKLGINPKCGFQRSCTYPRWHVTL